VKIVSSLAYSATVLRQAGRIEKRLSAEGWILRRGAGIVLVPWRAKHVTRRIPKLCTMEQVEIAAG